MREGRFTQGMLFKLPEILQAQTYLVPDGPVIILPRNGICPWPPLRMTLHAAIIRLNAVHSCRIQDVPARWMLHMDASRAVALFASNIPLRYLLRTDVVVHGVAPIASRTRRPVHVFWGVPWRPPVGSICYEIRTPDMIGDVPLCCFRKVIVPYFREITLFPKAAIHERDLVLRELRNGIRRKIGKDSLWKLTRIANNSRHRWWVSVLINL